jgi:probable addiction module antidote protein
MTRRSVSCTKFLHRNLRDDAAVRDHLQAALDDSPTAFLIALKNVLDARGVAVVAKASKLSREQIDEMLAVGGDADLDSLLKILIALGIRLSIDVQSNPAEPPIQPRGTDIGRQS